MFIPIPSKGQIWSVVENGCSMECPKQENCPWCCRYKRKIVKLAVSLTLSKSADMDPSFPQRQAENNSSLSEPGENMEYDPHCIFVYKERLRLYEHCATTTTTTTTTTTAVSSPAIPVTFGHSAMFFLISKHSKNIYAELEHPYKRHLIKHTAEIGIRRVTERALVPLTAPFTENASWLWKELRRSQKTNPQPKGETATVS